MEADERSTTPAPEPATKTVRATVPPKDIMRVLVGAGLGQGARFALGSFIFEVVGRHPGAKLVIRCVGVLPPSSPDVAKGSELPDTQTRAG